MKLRHVLCSVWDAADLHIEVTLAPISDLTISLLQRDTFEID
jgi:hypothetical protein